MWLPIKPHNIFAFLSWHDQNETHNCFRIWIDPNQTHGYLLWLFMGIKPHVKPHIKPHVPNWPHMCYVWHQIVRLPKSTHGLQKEITWILWKHVHRANKYVQGSCFRTEMVCVWIFMEEVMSDPPALSVLRCLDRMAIWFERVSTWLLLVVISCWRMFIRLPRLAISSLRSAE